MQPETKARRGLINDVVTADNVVSDSIAGMHTIVNGAGAIVAGPIRKESIREISWKASQPEKQQWVLIADNAEVIKEKTSYSVSMQFPRDRFDGANHDLRIFRTNSGSLSGTAATDRKNVYEAIAAKINAYVPNYTKAKLATLFNFEGAATVTEAGFAAGDKWYVGTDLASATWVGFVAKATGALAAAVDQNVLLVTESGTFPSDATTAVFKAAADDAVQSVADAASTFTASQGLVVYDQAGYFPSKERLGRGGAPIIFTKGFSGQPKLIQAHKYSNGIGTDMLSHTPEFDLTRQNMTAGQWQNQYSEAPVAGYTYTQYVIRCMGGGIPDAIDGRNADIMVEHVLFVKEATPGTPVAAFKTAILALK